MSQLTTNLKNKYFCEKTNVPVYSFCGHNISRNEILLYNDFIFNCPSLTFISFFICIYIYHWADINECRLRNGHGPCQDTCHNLPGGYKCSCDGLPGTILSIDGHHCDDLDECLVDNGGCSHTCLNTLGKNIVSSKFNIFVILSYEY